MRSHIRVEPVLPELESAGAARPQRREIEINTFRLDLQLTTRPRRRRPWRTGWPTTSSTSTSRSASRSPAIPRSSSRPSCSACRAASGRSSRRSAQVKTDNPGRLPEDMRGEPAPARALGRQPAAGAARAGRGPERRGLLPPAGRSGAGRGQRRTTTPTRCGGSSCCSSGSASPARAATPRSTPT